jgi:hypothetical protein
MKKKRPAAPAEEARTAGRTSNERRQTMKAMFANLTWADVRRRSPQELRTVARRRVHLLFDEIQVAIHNDDRTKIDYLMAELAAATGDESRSRTGRH